MNKIYLLKIAVHIGAWLPLAWMLYDYFTVQLTFNPIQAATQRTGQTAMVLYLLMLAITPVSRFMHWQSLIQLRRPLGLYTFLYSAIHLAIYIGLDYDFDWTHLNQSLIEKPFIMAGLTAFLILGVLTLTSFKSNLRFTGKGWKHLHRLVYLAGFIVILHYAWAKKGSILTMQGDMTLPIIAFVLYLGLMVARLPTLHVKARGERHPYLAVSPHTRKG